MLLLTQALEDAEEADSSAGTNREEEGEEGEDDEADRAANSAAASVGTESSVKGAESTLRAAVAAAVATFTTPMSESDSEANASSLFPSPTVGDDMLTDAVPATGTPPAPPSVEIDSGEVVSPAADDSGGGDGGVPGVVSRLARENYEKSASSAVSGGIGGRENALVLDLPEDYDQMVG